MFNLIFLTNFPLRFYDRGRALAMDLEIENIDQSKLIPKIDELPIRRFPDQLAQVSGSKIVTQIFKFLKSLVRKKNVKFFGTV